MILNVRKAPPRFELGNKGFADLCLTTWLWRRIQITKDAYFCVFCLVVNGAEDEIRTRDICLGKATLYHWATSAYLLLYGADEGTWTHMTLLSLEPESSASANSATSAWGVLLGCVPSTVEIITRFFCLCQLFFQSFLSDHFSLFYLFRFHLCITKLLYFSGQSMYDNDRPRPYRPANGAAALCVRNNSAHA